MSETRSQSLSVSAAAGAVGLWVYSRSMAHGYETQVKLDALMEGLSIEDPGSILQEAVSDIMGTEGLPVDMAFDGLVTTLAEHVGLKKHGKAGELAYAVTKIAILTTAEAIGIGSGFVSLDMQGFSLTRIQATVEDIQKKVDVLVKAPQKLAIQSYWDVLNKLQNRMIPMMIEEVKEMKRHARTAFVHSTNLEPTDKNLKDAVQVKILEMIAELLQSSFDGEKIVPFYLLSTEKKNCIADMMNKSIEDLKSFKEKMPKKYLKFDSSRQKAERQDMIDCAYKVAYPFISEARGMTNSLTKLTSSLTFPVLVQLLPEGANDKTRVNIGRDCGEQRAVWLWRVEKAIRVATWEGPVTEVAIDKNQEEVQVQISFPSEGKITE